jgi:virginiamycin B lyase
VKRLQQLLGAAAVTGLAACSGGGSSSPAVPPLANNANNAPAVHARGTATFTISVPRSQTTTSSATGRRPLYVSPNANSLVIQVFNADGSTPNPAIAPTVVVLASSTGGCTASAPTAPSSLTCTVNVAVPSGPEQFALSVFQSTDGSGPALGSAVVNETIAAGQVNTVPVTLGGVIASLAFNPARLVAPADGAVHALTTNVTALDASGAVIIAPGSFYSGISLAVSNDPNGALTLGTSAIPGPSASGTSAVGVNYNAAQALTNGTITASAAGAPSATASVTPLVYSISTKNIAAGAPATLSVSEAGAAGPFTVTASPATAATISGSGGTFSVAAGSTTGPATLTIGDGTVSGQLAITVTSTSGSVTVGAPPTISEFLLPTAGSYPNSIAPGPDGNLWFAEIGSAKIGKFSTAGTLVNEFALTMAPGRVTAGPDGNIWFTEFDPSTHNSAIGKMTTGGTLTQFTVPTAGAHALGIAAGPDGNLWFTEEDANKIGRITTSGTITEFTGMTSPRDIVAGPDGNLWFTEYNYQSTNPSPRKIGRITTGGTVTEFTIGADSTMQPASITVGPDGKIWFTEFDPNGVVTTVDIGTSTTSGSITLYTAGLSAGSQPDSIRTAADGNLWFTENTKGKIGRATRTGTINEFSSGLSGDPLGLCLGPDGKLWFTEFSGNAIGSVKY